MIGIADRSKVQYPISSLGGIKPGRVRRCYSSQVSFITASLRTSVRLRGIRYGRSRSFSLLSFFNRDTGIPNCKFKIHDPGSYILNFTFYILQFSF